MYEKGRDNDGNQAVEEMQRVEDVLGELSAAKAGRSKKGSELPQENPPPVEDDVPQGLVETSKQLPAMLQGRVMGGLTITELEMMPKMEEISRLKEIPVGGSTNIEPEVIAAIAGVAAEAVEGVAALGTTSLRRIIRERVGGAERRARGVSVEVGRREVVLDIQVRVIYGYSVPKTVISLRQNVADRLLKLCGLVAKEINIRVTGIEFPERMPGRVE